MPCCDPDPALTVSGASHVAIQGRPPARASGQNALAEGSVLIRRFCTTSTPIILVRMWWSDGPAGVPGQRDIQPLSEPAKRFAVAPSEKANDLEQPGDVLIRKRQQNAARRATLNLQSRLRVVRTCVLGETAATFDTKTAAHYAWQRECETVSIEAAYDEIAVTLRDMATTHLLPRIACVAYGIDDACSAT